MAIPSIVLGINPSYPRSQNDCIEVLYRSGDKIMRLDFLDRRPGQRDSAQAELEMHGMFWKAYAWRAQSSDDEWKKIQGVVWNRS